MPRCSCPSSLLVHGAVSPLVMEDDIPKTVAEESVSSSSSSTQIYSLLGREELKATRDHYLDLPLGTLQGDDISRIYFMMKAIINKEKGVAMGKAVESLLKRAIDEVNYYIGRKEKPAIKITNRLYYRVLDAWAKSESVGGVLRAQEILLNMERKFQQTRDDAIEPTVYGFNCVIDGWARVAHKFGSDESGKRAEALLAWMIQLNELEEGKSRNLKPDLITMNSLINAWSKSSMPNAAQRAQDILDYMEDNQELSGIRPNDVSYTSVIVGWTNSGDPSAAKNAEKILLRMEKLYENGVTVVKPNVVTYSSCINAYSKLGQARRAEELLQRMQSQYEKDGDSELKPNVFSYNAVIRAWSLCQDDPNGAHRAELYLRAMERKYKEGDISVKPDIYSYNSVLNSWAKSMKWEAVERAEKILAFMEKAYADGRLDFQPNTVSYTAIIDTYAKSTKKNSAEMAKKILSRMETLYMSGMNPSAKPNTHTMNTVIDAHAKCHEPHKAVKAYEIFCHMNKIRNSGNTGIVPNIFTYTTVLNACAFTFRAEEKEEAFGIALKVFQDLKANPFVQPTHLTYGTLIKAINNLLPRGDERRDTLIKPIFMQCCEDGQLGRFVLRSLQEAVPAKTYLTLLRGSRKGVVSVNDADLPSEWSRNGSYFCNIFCSIINGSK